MQGANTETTPGWLLFWKEKKHSELIDHYIGISSRSALALLLPPGIAKDTTDRHFYSADVSFLSYLFFGHFLTATMKYQASVVAVFLLAVSGSTTNAFVQNNGRSSLAVLRSAVAAEDAVQANSKMESLTNDLIGKLRFREVKEELERRALNTSGTLSVMKNRLREATMGPIRIEKVQEVRTIDGDALDEVRMVIASSLG